MVAILSLSGSQLSSNCKEVLLHMKLLGISGDVTCNATLLDDRIENGCRVVVASNPAEANAKRLWDALYERFSLSCAHVVVQEDVKSGCVWDVFRSSRCPGKKDSKSS